MAIITFCLGLLFGALIGFFVAALACAAGKSDREEEQHEDSNDE